MAEPQPLGLTVHRLPEAGAALAASARAQRTRRGRWQMLALLAVCAAPVAASYLAYYAIRPESRRNYGELIEPQRALPAIPAIPVIPARAPDGSTAPLSALAGQWLLLSVAGGACNAPCQRNLYLQRQLRESLGKDKERVDRVWLIDDAAGPPPALAPALQQATVLRVDGAALRAWLEPAPGHELAEHLYLVDPMGRWMLRFPAAMDAAGARRAKRDLERLLRASAAWDQAGRPGQKP